MFSNTLSVPFSPLLLGLQWYKCWIFCYLLQSQTEAVFLFCFFQTIFSLCCSDQVISINLSSSQLILSSVIFTLLTSSSSEFIPPEGEESLRPRRSKGYPPGHFLQYGPSCWCHPSLQLPLGRRRKSLTCRDIKASQARSFHKVGSFFLVLVTPVFLSGGAESWAQSQEEEHFTRLLIVSKTSSQSILTTFWACLVLSVELVQLEEERAYLGSLLFLGWGGSGNSGPRSPSSAGWFYTLPLCCSSIP